MVNRYGKSDTFRIARNGGVNSNDLTIRVDERTARITGVNRCVGLNKTSQPISCQLKLPVER